MPSRQAARALVLDASDRLLLVRADDELGSWWTTPGGGVEPGESDAEALRRELAEELGLRGFELGPQIWTREHWLVDPRRWGGQRERHYLVRTTPFEPVPDFSAAELVDEGVHEARWFSVADLEGLVTAPQRLGELVCDLLEHGPPPKPIDAGV
jgi:8-oxo-dGTP pyrophosphatase MutT (NUDIX family)